MCPALAPPHSFVVGLDENGLGALLGPMLVTGVLVRVDERGRRWLTRKLPRTLAADLGDSKKLVSFNHSELGEAWARALVPDAETPGALVEHVSLLSGQKLRQRCPESSMAQCWSLEGERFVAEDDLVRRMAGHLQRLARAGVVFEAVRCEVLCVSQLNDEKEAGGNRFVSDLHAMERLILAFRKLAGAPLQAHCGKVGGIADYDRFFGPLAGHLHTTLQQSRQESSYHFPNLGELCFTQDADAHNPVVMLASLVGKYLRELLMGRISQFYTARVTELRPASGYHDPVTQQLVRATAPLRKKLRILNTCFERVGAG